MIDSDISKSMSTMITVDKPKNKVVIAWLLNRNSIMQGKRANRNKSGL